MVEQCGAQDIIDDIKMGARTPSNQLNISKQMEKKDEKKKHKQSNRMLNTKY